MNIPNIYTLAKQFTGFRKAAVLLFWVAVIATYWRYTTQNELTPLETLDRLWELFLLPLWGPLIYLLFFSLQPLVFFPSALMGLIGGQLYGPWWGVAITTVGALGAASVTYGAGYFFGLDPHNPRFARLHRFRDRLERHTFEGLVTLHLLFMPFDLVNYFAGLLRLPWRPFLLSTLVGSIPGIFTFVFLGASVDLTTLEEGIAIDGRLIALSGATLLLSLALSRVVRRRRGDGEERLV